MVSLDASRGEENAQTERSIGKERGAQHGARSYLGELVRRHLLQRNAVDLDIVQRRDLVELLRPVVDVSHRASTAHWRAEVCAPAVEALTHTTTHSVLFDVTTTSGSIYGTR